MGFRRDFAAKRTWTGVSSSLYLGSTSHSCQVFFPSTSQPYVHPVQAQQETVSLSVWKCSPRPQIAYPGMGAYIGGVLWLDPGVGCFPFKWVTGTFKAAGSGDMGMDAMEATRFRVKALLILINKGKGKSRPVNFWRLKGITNIVGIEGAGNNLQGRWLKLGSFFTEIQIPGFSWRTGRTGHRETVSAWYPLSRAEEDLIQLVQTWREPHVSFKTF